MRLAGLDDCSAAPGAQSFRYVERGRVALIRAGDATRGGKAPGVVK